ncbi:hypothetical protein [Pseudomonas sp. RIT-PI-AD]|uniref:hypothetical protein n=1 Tax=Pseudomonas sp. RIT-PI-AD TaxID=3035294 RepID=UPI0021DB6933|nr:hypothetical protein [Pseudomonas sp. RIT-PI-AD]
MRWIRPSLAALFAVSLSAAAENAPYAPLNTPTDFDYGVLMVTRDRLEVSTSCEIGLYVQDRLAARLYQGQSVSFNLPPGETLIRLGIVGQGACNSGFEQYSQQSVSLRAGQIRKYRIAANTNGLYLVPANL